MAVPPPGMQYMQVLMPIPPSATGNEKGRKGKEEDAPVMTPMMMPAMQPANPGVYGGIQNHGVQQYLPIAEKRELEKDEQKRLKKGSDRWWPRIGAGYSTPMDELMADPLKSAILGGAGTAVVGALTGLVTFIHSATGRVVAAGLGLVGGGVLGGITSFINRRQQNDNIEDLMRRLPPGATKRDMLSDPVYQQDLTRQAMNHNNTTGNIATMALMSSFMSGSNTRR